MPGRTRGELALGRAIDAREGGRAAAEDAVRRWRALTPQARTAAVGAQAAGANARAAMDDEALQARARGAFAARGVRDADGVTLRAGGPPPPAEATGRALAVPPPPPPAATATTRYWIEFAGLYAERETAIDGGSANDEIFLCFNLHDAADQSSGARSGIYNSVDSGDAFGPQPGPLLLWGPEALPSAPIILSTLCVEHDTSNADAISTAWRDAAAYASCLAKYTGVDPDQAVIDSAGHLMQPIYVSGDDVIGWDSAVLSPEGLAQNAARPLITWKGITYNAVLFHSDGDARYWSFYRFRRFG